MSIADKILRLFRTKQELKQAVVNKGTVIHKEDKLSVYPSRLEYAIGDIPFYKCISSDDKNWSGKKCFAIPGKFWLSWESGLLRNYWLFVSPGMVYSEDAMVEIEEMSRGSAASSDAPVQDPIPDDQGGSSSPGLFEAKLSSVMSVKDGIRSIGRAFGLDFGEVFSDYPRKIDELPLPNREFYRCIGFDSIRHTWSGNHAEKRSDGYAFSDAVTEGLKFYGDGMLYGSVYSGDGMLAVKDIYEVKEINYLEPVSDIDAGIEEVPDYSPNPPMDKLPTCRPFSVIAELKGMRNGDSILFFDSSTVDKDGHSMDSIPSNASYSTSFEPKTGRLHFLGTGHNRYNCPFGQLSESMVLYPRIFNNGKLMEGSYMDHPVSVHFRFSSRWPDVSFFKAGYSGKENEFNPPIEGGKIRSDMDTYSYDVRSNLSFYEFREGDGFELYIDCFEDDQGADVLLGTAAISGDLFTYSPNKQEVGKKHIVIGAKVWKKGWPNSTRGDFMHISLEVIPCPRFLFDKEIDSISGNVGFNLFYSPSFRIGHSDGNPYRNILSCSSYGTVEGDKVTFRSDVPLDNVPVTLTGWLEDENGKQVGDKDTMTVNLKMVERPRPDIYFTKSSSEEGGENYPRAFMKNTNQDLSIDLDTYLKKENFDSSEDRVEFKVERGADSSGVSGSFLNIHSSTEVGHREYTILATLYRSETRVKEERFYISVFSTNIESITLALSGDFSDKFIIDLYSATYHPVYETSPRTSVSNQIGYEYFFKSDKRVEDPYASEDGGDRIFLFAFLFFYNRFDPNGEFSEPQYGDVSYILEASDGTGPTPWTLFSNGEITDLTGDFSKADIEKGNPYDDGYGGSLSGNVIANVTYVH